jgi:hypothetical protein
MNDFNPAALLVIGFGTAVGAVFGAAMIGLAVTLGVILFVTIAAAR